MRDEGRRPPLVAVIGPGDLPDDDPRLALARACGRGLVDAGCRLVTGGLSGVMRAASEGARSAPRYAPGAVVGVLPGSDPDAANAAVDVALATGLGVARNVLVASADAIVAVGGCAGTLSELAIAWQLRRLIVALRVPGWSGELADRRIDDRVRFPDLPEDRVFGADTAEEAVALVARWLPEYRRRR
jgi:uncharacterized protein (TIGR00725 family)